MLSNSPQRWLLVSALLACAYSFRFTETLRRFAETTMHALVRTVFVRLHQLDPVEEEEKLKHANDAISQQGELRMTVSTNNGQKFSDTETTSPDESRLYDEPGVDPSHPDAVASDFQDESPAALSGRTRCEIFPFIHPI